VLHLAQLAWIEEQANVCFFGPPGTGKTHCAIALAIKACEHGYRVAFATALEWVSRLEQAQDRNQLEQELRRLERYHLVVDEVGYLPLERQAANLLFALVARRYERGSKATASASAASTSPPPLRLRRSATPLERWQPDQPDSGANRTLSAARLERRGHRSAAEGLPARSPPSDPAPTGALFDCGNWCTFRLRLTHASILAGDQKLPEVSIPASERERTSARSRPV
jgi:hypothetical protein